MATIARCYEEDEPWPGGRCRVRGQREVTRREGTGQGMLRCPLGRSLDCALASGSGKLPP